MQISEPTVKPLPAYEELTNRARKPSNFVKRERRTTRHITHVPKISVQHLYVSVDDLQRHKLVVRLPDARYKEQRGIAPIHDLRVYAKVAIVNKFVTRSKGSRPLYSRKLHMRVRRARTSWMTSLMILAFCLGGIVTNHFARRTLPKVNSPF